MALLGQGAGLHEPTYLAFKVLRDTLGTDHHRVSVNGDESHR